MYWLKALKHFFISNSRHGTHSPFVYALADEVIYKRSVEQGHNGLISQIKKYYINKNDQLNESSFLVLSAKEINEDFLIKNHKKYFIIFLNDIHVNEKTEQLWRSVLHNENFIVTIDLFQFGIICYRSEQPKENFVLRFPYWKFKTLR